MTEALLRDVREGRRYGVPAEMVSLATARRAAGDVAGACAAAHADLCADVRAVAPEHADTLAADLRHLVPDLVRWHLPRWSAGGQGLIQPAKRITLARYGADALYVRTPVRLGAPQRFQVCLGPLDADDRDVRADTWVHARHLWDDRHTGELRERLGGRDRLPFHAPEGRLLAPDELPAADVSRAPDDPVAWHEWITLLQDAGHETEAWAAAGIPLEAEPESVPWWRGTRPRGRVSLPALRDALRRSRPGDVLLVSDLARFLGLQFRVSITEHGSTTVRLGYGVRDDDTPPLPRADWQDLPDPDLLRLGLLTPAELHPLVRDALFSGTDDDYRPVRRDPPTQTRVRCGSGWHRIRWHDGSMELTAHTPEEIRRESALRALGAPVPGCFTVTRDWETGTAAVLRKDLRALRRHAVLLLVHGDTAGFVRLLDTGLPPAGIRRRDGRGPLHLLGHLDPAGHDLPALVDRLVAAGIDPNAKDAAERTPLQTVLHAGGTAPLVRALLDAGADPTAVDGLGQTTLHLLRSPDAATILPWLLAAGLDPNSCGEYGERPLISMIEDAASPAVIRALIAAGADPALPDESYPDWTPRRYAEYQGRTDLDFLP